MNILILNPNITIGGAQRIVLNLAYYLEKLGNQVWIFTTLVDYQSLPDKFRKLKIIKSKYAILKKSGTTTQYQNIDNLLVLFLRLLQIRFELIRIIKQKKIAVVIVHQQPFNWVLAFYTKCLVIWNCFEPIAIWQTENKNYLPLRVEKSNPMQKLLEGIYEWFDKKIIHYGIRHIFVLSELTKKHIYNLYRKKAFVFPVGVDPDLLNQKVDRAFEKKYRLNPTFNILQVGHFNYEKNQLLTIEVFKKVLQKIPQAKLILIGDGALRPAIEKKIKAYRLSNKVILTGRIEPLNSPLLAYFYSRSKVVVFPSLIQSWGLVPFEALGFGTLPLVSDKCGSAQLINKEKIGLVMKLNQEDYCRKLFYIYAHPQEVKRIAGWGKKYVRSNLTYEVYAQKIQEKIWTLQ